MEARFASHYHLSNQFMITKGFDIRKDHFPDTFVASHGLRKFEELLIFGVMLSVAQSGVVRTVICSFFLFRFAQSLLGAVAQSTIISLLQHLTLEPLPKQLFSVKTVRMRRLNTPVNTRGTKPEHGHALQTRQSVTRQS